MQSNNNNVEIEEINIDDSMTTDQNNKQTGFTFSTGVPVTESAFTSIGVKGFGIPAVAPSSFGGSFGSSPAAAANPFGVATAPAATSATATAATTAAVAAAFGASPFGSVNSQNKGPASMAGAFGFGPAQQTQQRINPGGCCSQVPPNIQRHPETGIPFPKPTQPAFGINCNQMPFNNSHNNSHNNSRDRLIDEIYSELHRLRDQVNESNALIDNMYKLLRKLN
jgi:hypothetical protein